MSEPDHNGQNVPSYHTHPAQKAKVSMIATPLGNLQDLSPRVRHALTSADELWCEDTRHTLALLQAIQAPRIPMLRRLDQHSDPKEVCYWLEKAEQSGQWIGVVTDAGTPGVSDPGGLVVKLVTQFPMIRIEAIPGPSAVSALASIAGFEENSFIFKGFFPRSESEILSTLDSLRDADQTRNWIFFESPHRIEATLEALSKWETPAEYVFAKELTKVHETVIRGSGPELWKLIKAGSWDWRGEWCVAVILPKSCVIQKKTQSDWELALECLIAAKIGPKEAIQHLMQRFSVAKNLAYRKAIEIQKKMHNTDSSA
jgi:16S rRNA (cytidine1402-2'-O)-methyltransferase